MDLVTDKPAAPPPFDPDESLDLDAVVNPRFRFSFAGTSYDLEPFALARALRGLTEADNPAHEKFEEHLAATRKVLGFPEPGEGVRTPDPAQVVRVVVTFWRWMPRALGALGESFGVKPKSPTASAGTPTSSDASPLPTATS